MVGVFAAVDDIYLYLKTTVAAIDEMQITSSEDTPEWATGTVDGVTTTESSISEYGIEGDAKSVDFDDPELQLVGYLHVRTNNYAGITVSIKATPLVGDTHEDTIHYVVFNEEDEVFDTADDGDVTVAFYGIDADTALEGLRKGSQEIYVQLEEDAPTKVADDYTGYITFEYTINS